MKNSEIPDRRSDQFKSEYLPIKRKTSVFRGLERLDRLLAFKRVCLGLGDDP